MGWNLAILNSSNLDYVSNMNKNTGSHLIYSFYLRAIKCLDQGLPIFLGQIFNEVQTVLGRTHQLPVYSWNNGTENVVLEKNQINELPTVQSDEEMLVEMVENKKNNELVVEEGDVGSDDDEQKEASDS